ncbi:MAG TPA: response regulator transcription factor [Candidatus Angelobacter sp.]|nr:response regulator transcription factor [Candidatus Angelobacter sp.]
MSRILLVEDEAHIAQGLRFNLEADGHTVAVTDRGEDALNRLLERKEDFDILVLDVMLPGQDGFSVARELRASRNYIPLLMLTARGRPEDVLKGFESGADDYLPKPFNLDILMARIGSLLRRKSWQHNSEQQDLFRFDGKTVDFAKLELRTDAKVFQLTVMEIDLLRYLIRNSGRPVSRKAILEDVWNLREDTDTRAIDNFVVRLRRYIEDEPSKPRHLITVRGLGYQFVPNP